MDTGLLPLTFYERCTLRYAAVQEPVKDEKHAHETKTMISISSRNSCALVRTLQSGHHKHTHAHTKKKHELS